MHEIIEKCDINLTYDQFQDLIDNLDKNNDGKIVFEGKLIDSLPIEKVF
jgi:Ca2+-binding EF-hand superfamily protein